MAKGKHPHPQSPAQQSGPACPPPDDPLHRAAADEPVTADEAASAALARMKALEDAERMQKEQRPESPSPD
jgi:hypothetical protein